MNDNELAIPPDALTDSEGFELLRLWAAHGELHVAISGDLGGEAEDFGELLSDLFEHASRMFAQRDGRSLEDCRQGMLEDFLRRVEQPKASIVGSLPTEH